MKLLSKIGRLVKKECDYGIVLFKDEAFDFQRLKRHEPILQFKIDNLVKPNPLVIQADPFLFVKGHRLYLFYESQYAAEKGILRMTSTTDLKEWTAPVTVLKEPFHLSYPFVFDYQGETYMIPESEEANCIRLYKGNEDLTEFHFVRTLLTKERTEDIKANYCDSHLLFKDGTCYLFTSVSYGWTYHLELYATDDLLHHDFVSHPQSPIYIGNDHGRCGGSVLHLDDSYYRVSQNCLDSYGGNVSLLRITAIDKDNYQEELYKKDLLEPEGIFKEGGHQLNIVKFNGQYVYATDYRKVAWCWYQAYLRIKNKLLRHH